MSTPLLCETVTGRSTAELLKARDAATQGDLVELRLDGVADVDVAAVLADRERPVIVTCRPRWEGGAFEGAEEERRAILGRALELGAEYVDLEWRAGFDDLIARDPSRVVLSSHDFEGVPADLAERARAMRGAGARTIKVAVTTTRLSDTLALAEIGRAGDAVVIGMGEAGIATRLLPARFGSKWTYAGNAVAPGQIAAARMVDEFGFRRVKASTRVFGVVSTNAMHSASPAMHNAAFAACGIDAVYVPFRAGRFDDFLTFAPAMNVEGVSVTIPFKLDALRAAARVDDLTRTVGAANTLRCREAGWEATNTDVAGFLAPLEQLYPGSLCGARAAVLGAGGSARAVVAALTSRGAVATVHARRREQAEALASLGGATGEWPPRAGSWDLLVNCTPLGGATHVDESPLPVGPFDGRLVYDLTYGTRPSRLLRDARDAGCLVLDGLPMLVAQAELQFEWWTGVRPPAGVMRAAAETRLGIDAGAAAARVARFGEPRRRVSEGGKPPRYEDRHGHDQP
jgi:3-dehydroquinate dehydratase/shikimate dehydrogenase